MKSVKSLFGRGTGDVGKALPVSAKDFLVWAAQREIICDDRHSTSEQALVFKPYRSFQRFWECPQEPNHLVHFLRTFLEAMPTWQSCYLWSRNGCWAPTTAGDGDSVIATAYRGAGIPEGWQGAIHFSRDDLASILTVLFVHCAFGWSICEDVSLVADHARLIAFVDHHNVIWAEFACAEELEPFVQRMAAAGYTLPVALPDPTFQPQPWITGKSAQAAPRNDGPTAPPGNSGIAEGPPSVS